MNEIVVADIGGTHARFAIASVDDRSVPTLSHEAVIKTAEHSTFESAWRAYGTLIERPLPEAVSIAVAGPVNGDVVQLTNNSWVIRPALIPERIGAENFRVINDFAAVAHAVAAVGPEQLQHLCGPDLPLPPLGVTTVVGPGTGLGVAQLIRLEEEYHVVPTEGGHMDFAPLDDFEDGIVKRLRQRYRRVSAERIVSGPGLLNIYEALAAIDGRPVLTEDPAALWTSALTGEDRLAVAALDRFCLCLGAVAGDLALTHGATGVVIGGGIGLRLVDRLPNSGFASRFSSKGRFEAAMAQLPVKLITHPQTGLLGAAAAYVRERRP